MVLGAFPSFDAAEAIRAIGGLVEGIWALIADARREDPVLFWVAVGLVVFVVGAIAWSRKRR